MRKVLYNKLIFLLYSVRILRLISSLLLNYSSKSLFFEWNLAGRFNALTATFFVDWKATIFLATVCFISANVILYRKRYMADDQDADRFILIVFGFILSITLLIISPNILSLLLGWDGLGIMSYCLVIYYPTKKSRRAGILTVIRNRVGDVCILLSIGLISSIGDYVFIIWGSFDFNRKLLFYLIIFAAITKSAQLPFSAWLPAAIAAPTPVSALVHSSTLVTAGVYLLIRFSELIDSRDKWVLLFLSTLTIFISGLVANFEHDLKKVIALSTLSQLGLMMFSISLGLYDLAFFHLVIHALFKAILFLSAGAIIHAVGGSQDIRICGNLLRRTPFLTSCINYANLSLSGIPFLAGFYSKDLIIELASRGNLNQFMLLVIFISVGLTIGYRLRLSYYTRIKTLRQNTTITIYEVDYLVILPILFLTLLSIPSGAMFNWVGLSTPCLIFLPLHLKIIALVIVTRGLVIRLTAISSTLRNFKISFFYFINSSMWFLPFNSSQLFSPLVLDSGKKVLQSIDTGWLEYTSMESLNTLTLYFNRILEIIQKNQIKSHILFYLILTLFLF